MKRFLMLIPLVLSLAILFSAAERTNIKPHYTADIAVSEQGNILLANKGTQVGLSCRRHYFINSTGRNRIFAFLWWSDAFT